MNNPALAALVAAAPEIFDVQELVTDGDTIRGVRYRGHGGWHEICTLLTVGADGRHSKVRELIGEVSIGNTPLLDVLWFRLLSQPLKSGVVKVANLAKVQRQRELPMRIIQGFQSIPQKG
jgi:2-polyprenyl-6-methoxyphenol hydroxylase-like FAD-dependent oxidoreductase